MKNIIIYIFLLTSFNLYSQYKIVEYEVISKQYKTDNKTPEANEYIELINKSSNKFKLTFNENVSYFNIINNISEENKVGNKLSLILLDFKPTYYLKNQNEIYFEKEGLLIKKDSSNYKWNILNETKKINNLDCFKAILKEKFTNRKGEEKDRNIIAWFCPEIPFSFGPLEYCGLPGLIMELDKNENKIVVKKIKSFDENIDLNLPKTKIISEQDFLEKIKQNSLLNESN